MAEQGICTKCKKSVGCPYADERIKGCKKFILEKELELTNKEYMQTCSSDELANTIFRLIVHGTVIRPDREYIKKWLKEVHNG